MLAQNNHKQVVVEVAAHPDKANLGKNTVWHTRSTLDSKWATTATTRMSATGCMTKFEGETKSLKGYVFDMVGLKSIHLFGCTMRQLVVYVGYTCQHSGDTCYCHAVKTLQQPTLHAPPCPTCVPC